MTFFGAFCRTQLWYTFLVGKEIQYTVYQYTPALTKLDATRYRWNHFVLTKILTYPMPGLDSLLTAHKLFLFALGRIIFMQTFLHGFSPLGNEIEKRKGQKYTKYSRKKNEEHQSDA